MRCLTRHDEAWIFLPEWNEGGAYRYRLPGKRISVDPVRFWWSRMSCSIPCSIPTVGRDLLRRVSSRCLVAYHVMPRSERVAPFGNIVFLLATRVRFTFLS